MVINHIGIVVRSIEKAVRHWEEMFGYKQITEVVTNTRQKVKVSFMSKEDSLPIKLLEPVDETSSVYTFAKKGGGLHHICFICEKLETGISELQSNGARLLVPPQPGEAFDNENIAFLYCKNGLNIEMIDTDKRAGLIPANL